MQDVDFEMKYESGEIHIRFIVRHLLPIIGNKDIEKVLKATIVTEDTVVLDTIKEETQGDEILQKLRRTFKTGNWERAKKDVDLVPFYLLKDELYDPPRMLFRMERVVQPTSLQQKIIKTAHNQ